MNDRRRVIPHFVFLCQSECMCTTECECIAIPKCTTSVKYLCTVADFSKGHIQMLILAPRDGTELNCKTSRIPAFRDDPPFLAI